MLSDYKIINMRAIKLKKRITFHSRHNSTISDDRLVLPPATPVSSLSMLKLETSKHGFFSSFIKRKPRLNCNLSNITLNTSQTRQSIRILNRTDESRKTIEEKKLPKSKAGNVAKAYANRDSPVRKKLIRRVKIKKPNYTVPHSMAPSPN
jgi:hypothetical protein